MIKGKFFLRPLHKSLCGFKCIGFSLELFAKAPAKFAASFGFIKINAYSTDVFIVAKNCKFKEAGVFFFPFIFCTLKKTLNGSFPYNVPSGESMIRIKCRTMALPGTG